MIHTCWITRNEGRIRRT